MNNGEIITIKELPLFSEQELWEPERTTQWNKPEYFIKIK